MIGDGTKQKRRRGRPSKKDLQEREARYGQKPDIIPAEPEPKANGKIGVESARVRCGRCGHDFYPRKDRMHGSTVETYCPGCGEVYRKTLQQLEIMKRFSRNLNH